MSFSTVLGEKISNQHFVELRTAIDERRLNVSGAGGYGWSTATGREKRWYQDIVDCRNQCSAMLASGTSVGIVKSDLTTWTDINEVLTTAGYPSGWITPTHQADGALIVQLQTVLGLLTYYQNRVTGSDTGYVSGDGVRNNTGGADHEACWDNMVASTIVGSSNPPGYGAGTTGVAILGNYTAVASFSEMWGSHRTRSYDFSALKGDFVEFRIQLDAEDTGTDDLLGDLTFECVASGNSFQITLPPGGTVTQVFHITSGMSFGGTSTYNFGIVPPANWPWDHRLTVSNGSTDGGLSELGSSLPNVFGNIASILTYG